MSFLSGPYVWSFGPKNHTVDINSALGVVEDAPTFRFARESDPIVGDNLGAAIQGVVDRGGNLFVDMILQELNADAVLRAWWPYDPNDGATEPKEAGIPNQLGRIGTPTSRSIGRLTPSFELRATKILNPDEQPGQPNADDIIAPGIGRLLHNLHFDDSQLAPGFDITQLLGSRHRNVPMSFLCSAFVSSGDIVYWTQS